MPQTTSSTGSTRADQSDQPDQASGSAAPALASEHGRTTIADGVVAKIAGIAAREVNGVYALGGGAARAVGALRDRLTSATGQGGPNVTQGVSVQVGDRDATVDLTLVAEYGVSIADLADGIRSNVISAVERMTGLQVSEVNIDVEDVHLESEDTDSDASGAGSSSSQRRAS